MTARPNWSFVSYGLFAIATLTAVVAGIIWVASLPNPPAVEILLPTPTPQVPMIAHIAGAVHDQGVHTLPNGARVADAIRAAGGALEDADTHRLNLAARVEDGQRIHVPWAVASVEDGGEARTFENAPGSSRTGASGLATDLPFSTIAAVATRQADAAPDLIDLNTADAADLMSLPGIGEVRAQAILRWRDANGPIEDVEDLTGISGIGIGTVSAIRPLVTPQ